MRLKKISILSILLVFLLPNLVKAEMLFLDNNAISNFSDVNTHLVVSEFNTGKIISKRGENKQVSVSNLPNHLALFLLTDDLKNNKISLDTKIKITNSDAILNKYNLSSSVSVQDALFLLENEESNALLEAIFTKYAITIEKAKNILSSMSLNDTTLASLTIDEKNMIFSLKNLKNIANLNIYKDGLISIQDYSSMLCVIASGVIENQTVLDICAAPGGKSIFMSQLMKNKGSILSMDISQNKLNLLSQQCKRLGIDIITTKVNDATIYNETYKEKFDVVLADVPCSGIGILRRKPEIRYKNADEIQNLPEIQKIILENSSKYVKKTGRLIYSTCTLGKEENQNIIEEFIKNNTEFNITYQKEYYPNVDKTDGFYVCIMDRNNDKKN